MSRSPIPVPDPSLLPDVGSIQRQLRRATALLALALGSIIVVLVVLVALLYRSAQWVDHTDRVIAEANRAERILLTMQTGFRGFRLSNDPVFLKPYTEARAQLEPQLDALAQLAKDNPTQAESIAALRGEARAWLDFVESELERVRTGQATAGDSSFLAGGAPLFQKTQTRLDAFIAEEARLRTERETRLHAIVIATMAGFGLVALTGLPALSIWIRHVLRRTNAAYRASLLAAQRRATELDVTLNSIGDAVVATDAQGKVNFLNPTAEKLTGWSSAEARGRELPEVFQIFNEATLVPVENPVARVLRENVTVGLANHTVLRAKGGREYPIDDSAAPIRNDRGEILGVILVFHDVTQHRELERVVEASERRFRFLDELSEATRILAEPAQIMAVTARLLGTHLRASRCAYAEVEPDSERFTILHDYTDGCASTAGAYQLSLFGPRAVAEMRGGRTLVVQNVDAELAAREGAAMFNAIGIKAIVCLPLVKDGRLRAMMAVHQTQPRAWTAAEVSLVQEVVSRCWATIERARAESELRATLARAEALARGVAESAERFRLLAEVVSLQVWTAGLDGQLDYVNQECVNYFGVSPERELLGNAWVQFVHPEDLPEAQQAWGASLTTGERYEVEFRLRRKDGAYRWFLVRAQAMRDPAGHITKWFGSNTDTDEMKRAQSAAEQASRAKDDFLAVLSHELRTPLTPVLMSAAALQEDERLPHDLREQLAMMARNIALEARLIDDLLDLTSIARGKLQLRTEPCDAHALIALAMEIVREDAGKKQIVIERTLSAQLTGLAADPARFQQVVWNLLRNAVKFTPRGGRIRLATRDLPAAATGASARLQITVADSGIGIPADALEKIFLPFEQAGLVGDHRYGGMGLGLAIARAIVVLHGGTIRAESAGENRGATFVIELPSGAPIPADQENPRANIPAGAGASPGVNSRAGESTPLRILLVEDHESTLQVLHRLLQRDGHTVATATCVADALATAAAQSFDLVISDLGLPDGTGNELMEKLRANYSLPGIALTGYGMENDIAATRAAGFLAHLIKPVDFAQLRRLILTLR